MKRFLFALTGLAALVLPAAALAARVEADPRKVYTVTPEVGPWMICVTHYSGEHSQKLANELALEIRRRDNLPAYIFDRGEEQRRKHLEEKNQLKQMFPDADLKRLRTTRISDECVVLVGGYKDMEAARRELERVKKLKPPQSEKLMPFLAEVRPVDGGSGAKPRGEVKGAHVNPFPSSFVARNPTVPAAPPVATNPDQFLKQLNANEEYSLLKCRQPFTLVVAIFQGASMVQSASTSGSFLDKLWGKGQGDLLAASGQNAHNLAEVLRKLQYEAYVLHRRQDSLVTIGGFSSPEDPRIRQIQQALTSNVKTTSSVKLLPQPFPLEVPRP